MSEPLRSSSCSSTVQRTATRRLCYVLCAVLQCCSAGMLQCRHVAVQASCCSKRVLCCVLCAATWLIPPTALTATKALLLLSGYRYRYRYRYRYMYDEGASACQFFNCGPLPPAATQPSRQRSGHVKKEDVSFFRSLEHSLTTHFMRWHCVSVCVCDVL